jgi:enamine deaminase RidA (YjgF/YER057c/UK114 family)
MDLLDYKSSNLMSKQFLNPDSLFPSVPHGFSQIVTAGSGKTVYISGQTAWNAQKQLIGGNDLAQQARQALRNVRLAVEAAGGTLADVVALRIYIVNYKPEQAAAVGAMRYESFFQKKGGRPARG